jgi:hypothetical protein
MIAWDNNIKTKTGRFVPLELDKTTPHKHYESATVNNNKNDNNNNDTSLPSKNNNKTRRRRGQSCYDKSNRCSLE